MTTSKRIAVKIGEYTDRSGKTKGRWKTLGELITKDDGGMFVKLDATILSMQVFALANKERNDHILASLFSDDDKPASASTPPSAPATGHPAFEDDTPF
jgi:hypothetical protein